MVIFRLLLIAFNVVVATYLVYRLFIVIQEPIVKWKKILVVFTGVLLLVAPFGIFLDIFRPSFQYFLIYPVVLVMFLYLIREVR
jgi:hypothetical protein